MSINWCVSDHTRQASTRPYPNKCLADYGADMTAPDTTTTKRILEFQASALRPREECERHYLEVHSPWAVRALAENPALVGYHTNLLVGQWDIAGGFRRTPDLWRYASMRFRAPGAEFPPTVARMLAHDHQNFLRDLRRFDVEETVLHDGTTGQLSSDKYVLVVDRPARLSVDEGWAALDELLALLGRVVPTQYGARRLVLNRVLVERENAPLREPGQRPTGGVVEDSTRLAYVEVYLDHEVWGDELFARPELLALLSDSPFAPDSLTAYHVVERAGHDRS